jgi:cytochrome bd-type quinol oxidase subunit 2
MLQINPIPLSKDIWLAFLFGTLFLLFPIALSLSNVVLLLIFITWLVTLKGQGYGNIFKSTPVL